MSEPKRSPNSMGFEPPKAPCRFFRQTSSRQQSRTTHHTQIDPHLWKLAWVVDSRGVGNGQCAVRLGHYGCLSAVAKHKLKRQREVLRAAPLPRPQPNPPPPFAPTARAMATPCIYSTESESCPCGEINSKPDSPHADHPKTRPHEAPRQRLRTPHRLPIHCR